MNENTAFEFMEKLKEIYTLVIEVLDIAPGKNLCSNEMNEVLGDIHTLRESFYLIEELLESDKGINYIQSLVTIPDCHISDDFSKAVGMLKRPYIPLSEDETKNIENITRKSNSDFIKDNKGNIYTWGKADGIMQLMPIQKEYYHLIVPGKSKNKNTLNKMIEDAETKQDLDISERIEQNNILDATFVSVWDDGVCIETTCKVNILSRVVFDIKIDDKCTDFVNILDREFVRMEDGTEFNVEQDFKGDYFLSSLNKESVVDNIRKNIYR